MVKAKEWAKKHQEELMVGGVAIGVTGLVCGIAYKLSQGEMDVEDLVELSDPSDISDAVSIYMGGLSDDGSGGNWLLTIADETIDNGAITMHDIGEVVQDIISGDYKML